MMADKGVHVYFGVCAILVFRIAVALNSYVMESRCYGVIDLDDEEHLHDHSFILTLTRFNRNYFPDMMCELSIRARENTTLLISFQEMNIDGDGDGVYCQDYVSIVDGDMASPTELIAKRCGTVLPKYVVSSGRDVVIVFRSDSVQQDVGFTLLITQVTYSHPCGFSCDNGYCIDPSLTCDNYNNCGDDSDEHSCDTSDTSDTSDVKATNQFIYIGCIATILMIVVVMTCVALCKRRRNNRSGALVRGTTPEVDPQGLEPLPQGHHQPQRVSPNNAGSPPSGMQASYPDAPPSYSEACGSSGFTDVHNPPGEHAQPTGGHRFPRCLLIARGKDDPPLNLEVGDTVYLVNDDNTA